MKLIHSKSISIAIGLLTILAILAGCGGKAPAPAAGTGSSTGGSTAPSTAKPAAPTTFHFFTTAEPTTMDPALVMDTPTIVVLQNLFEPMITFDSKGNLIPGLAKAWKISDDGITYTFTLQDAKFTDGTPITAELVKWSWERALNPDTKSGVASLYLGDILGADDILSKKATTLSGVKAVDAKTLEVKLVGNRPYFLSKLTYATSAAVPKAQIEKEGAKWIEKPVSYGPYKLTEWVHNSQVTLVKNPDYYGDKAKVDTITYAIVPDQQTAWGMYQAGQLDSVQVPAANVKAVLADAKQKAEYVGWSLGTVGYFALNPTVYAPFKDVKVRQAFNYAIDKDSLINVALENTYDKADGIIPPTVPGGNKSLKPLSFNVATAKKLMADAGYPDGKGLPKLTITIRAQNETIRKMAQFVQNQLKTNIGVDADIQEVEWGVYLANQKKRDVYASFIHNWGADYLDPQDFLDILFSSTSANDRWNYNNPKVDELIKQGNTAVKWDDRVKAYNQAEQIIVDDAAWVPLYFAKNHYMVKPFVKGFEYNAMGVMPFNHLSIQK